MTIAVQELIEKYIHIIEQNNIEMLLYLAYRDRYNNFEVYQLRSVLNKAGVCSLEESKQIAEKLFKEAFSEQMKLNNLRIYPEQIINYSALHFNYEDEKLGGKVSANKKRLTTLVKAEVKR